MLPSGAGSSSGNRACSCTAVSGWLAASRAASTMRLIRIGSIGIRSWVIVRKRLNATLQGGGGKSPPLQGEGWVGMGFPSAQAVVWQNCCVRKTHRHPDLPVEGEGERRSRIVIGRSRAFVIIELARQLQRRGVAVAGGQRLEVDRPECGFLHHLQQALLGQLEDGQERDHDAEPASARLEQRLEAG